MFILKPEEPRTDLQPEMQTQMATQKTLRFCWEGSTHSARNTAKVSDWLVSQNDLCICHDADINTSVTIQVCPAKFSPWALLIYVTYVTVHGRIFKHSILNVKYNKKETQKPRSMPSSRNCVTTQFNSHKSFPNLHHILFTKYMFSNEPHFFIKNQ